MKPCSHLARFFLLATVACILLAAGCKKSYTAQTRFGAAAVPTSPIVVLFPVSCHSSDDRCEDSYGVGVTALIATELEFAGYRVIDAEKLVRTARTREDQSASLTMYREKIASASTRRQVGSILEDLPPDARRELLAEAGASGLVTAQIKLLTRDTNSNWLLEVQIRHGSVDGALVWVSRCKHESYWNEKDSWSSEQAAKCALKSALAHR